MRSKRKNVDVIGFTLIHCLYKRPMVRQPPGPAIRGLVGFGMRRGGVGWAGGGRGAGVRAHVRVEARAGKGRIRSGNIHGN